MKRLRQIRDAVPPFEVTMRDKAVQMQLLIYGRRKLASCAALVSRASSSRTRRGNAITHCR
jgi:hypothetical protein